MVEFVSANPTGPMHMGNARGGVLGDTPGRRARLACGADVWPASSTSTTPATRSKSSPSRIEARYHPDSSRARMPFAFPEDGYHGDDIRELAKAFYDYPRRQAIWKSPSRRSATPILAQLWPVSATCPKMKERPRALRHQVSTNWFFESSLHEQRLCGKDTVEELQ